MEIERHEQDMIDYSEKQIIGESLDLILAVQKRVIFTFIEKLKAEKRLDNSSNFHLGFEINKAI